MTSGWPRDQRDKRWPSAENDDTAPEARARGRLATQTGPQTPISPAGSDFGTAHPSGPLPVGPTPHPSGPLPVGRTPHPSGPLPVGPMPPSRGRLGRGRSRADDDDLFGQSDADYDWIRYLGETGPAQGTATRDRSTDSVRPDRATRGDRRAQRDGSPAEDQRTTDRRNGDVTAWTDSAPPRAAATDSATAFLPKRSDSVPRRAPAADGATAFRSGTHRRERPEPARPDPADSWWTERGWPANQPAPSTDRAADTLATPTARPPAGPASRPFARPMERPPAPPAERSFDATPRPDDGRPGRSGAGHRRPRATVDTGPETARSPIEERKFASRIHRDRGRRADVEQAPATDTRRSGPLRAVAKDAAVAEAPTTVVAKPAQRSARAKARRRHRTLVKLIALVAAVAIVPAAALAVLHSGLLRSTGPDHTISVPATLLGYTQESALAKGMGAQALRADIVSKGKGEASHVVDGVYEHNVATAAKASPLIILFIGGNLSGSAASFIASFTDMLPGAFATSAGSLGGQAACVPGTSGRPAECAWADDDTFGLFASPTMSAAVLGKELRAMRPFVEHRQKS